MHLPNMPTAGAPARELGIDDDVALAVLSPAEVKNHEMFLESVARVGLDNVRYVIIGDGSLRASFEAKARSLRIENQVIFAGGRKDPEYFYPALDIVALTSRNEGTPLTLIEAMANARPVIATLVGGVVDLVGDERGVGIRPNDVDAFAAGLGELIKNRSLRERLGRNGFEFVNHNYRKERLLEDIKDLYGELLNRERVAHSELRVAKYS